MTGLFHEASTAGKLVSIQIYFNLIEEILHM